MRFRAGWYSTALLCAVLALLGFAEAIAVYVWNPAPRVATLQLVYALVTALIMLFIGRAKLQVSAAPGWMTGALLVTTFLVSILLAQFAMEAYPLSGDEYGYNYVADTLLRGHLWNQAYSPAIRDVLATNYIGGHGDQRLSQYAPGWPVFLMPFKLAGIPQFANAVVGLIAAIFLLKALRCLSLPKNVCLAVFALAIAAPFTVFNNASFYSHPLTAAALLGIIWLELRDASTPTPWNRVGIGLGFSVLLTVRYEAFFLSFVLFAIDGLWRHRLRFVGWALPAVAGAAPVTLLFLAYNWQITGSPFTTTLTWVSPGIGYGLNATGMDGPHSARRAILNTFMWFSKWQDFASVLLLPFYAVALWFRIARRTLRWFDLLWPVVVVFFFFFPDSGGYQYGPRYWYIAHAAMPVTIAAGFPVAGNFWQIGRWRFDPLRLVAAQLAAFSGFTVGYAIFLHLQIENLTAPRRLVETARPPAMLLMPTIGRRYVSWQGYSYQLFPGDYTRNGLGDLGPVVMGLDLGDERTALLCTQVPERAIYRVHLDRIGPGASLIPVCNGATNAAALP